MSKNESGIIDVQKDFKVKLIKQMDNQNKRYQHALKVIELLKLKINKEKSLKKTKKLSLKRTNSKANENSNNILFQNKKTLNLFKKINSALNNVINTIEIIKKNKYIDKISKFISNKSTDEEQKIILMETIEIVQKYIKDNMNVETGILVDINHKLIFNLFNEILISKKMEDNLAELKELVEHNTQIKFNKENSFKTEDLYLLKNDLIRNQEKMNIDIDIFGYQFQYNNNKKIINITFNQLSEKIKDCMEFIEKDNNLQI
jgi:hypothetical protein